MNFDVSRIVTKEVDLQVTRAPVILDSTDSNIRVVERQSATLLCKADGFPKPEVVWRRENDDIMFTKGSSYIGQSLFIENVKKEDRGRYICEVSNGIGEPATKSVLLEVSFGPIVASKRPKTGQSTGYEAELICKVTSYPPAAVSWTRNDKEMNNNENYEISYLGVTNEETISTLRFKSVAHHDYGAYMCKAKNAFGSGETTLELFGRINNSHLNISNNTISFYVIESEIPAFPFKF